MAYGEKTLSCDPLAQLVERPASKGKVPLGLGLELGLGLGLGLGIRVKG